MMFDRSEMGAEFSNARKSSGSISQAIAATGARDRPSPTSSSGVPRLSGATPTSTSNSQAQASASRGLSSLPPRPSHLPQRPYNPHSSRVGAVASSISAPLLAPAPAPAPALAPASGSQSSQSNTAPSSSQPHLPTRPRLTAPPRPPSDGLTFLASLSVSIPLVAEVAQEMVGAYELWHRVESRVADGQGMLKLLEGMGRRRRGELEEERKGEGKEG